MEVNEPLRLKGGQGDDELTRRHVTNYLRNVSKKNANSYFKLPWGGAVVKNCDSEGELLHFKTVEEYKNCGRNMWILLKLAIFRDANGEAFCEYICTNCISMLGMESLKIDQNKIHIEERRCHHSKVARRKIGDDFEDLWGIPCPPNEIEACQIFCNEEIKEIKLLNDQHLFLACVHTEKKISILYTVTERQKFPLCSKCTHRRCSCFTKFEKAMRPEEDNDIVSDSDEENEDENIDKLPWERFMTHKVAASHYDDPIPLSEYYNEYGANLTEIQYPFTRNTDLHKVWINRTEGDFVLPSIILAKVNKLVKCQHENNFDSCPSEDFKRHVISKTCIIYRSESEFVRDIEIIGRTTLNESGQIPCKCILQPDCTEILLWNVGNGEMVDFVMLNSFIQAFATSGVSIEGFLTSR